MPAPVVASYQPYCPLNDFLTNSLGADLSSFSVDNGAYNELTSLLIDASVRADTFMQTDYQYKTITNEKQNWRGDWRKRWEIFPYYGPIRTVTKFSIAVSAHSGAYSTWDVPVTPADTASDDTVFGDVFIDRDVGYVQTTDILLKYGMGIAYLATPMNPPQVIYSYTAGYNPVGTPGADGINIPVPQWLIEGTRHIARWLVDERRLTRNGMGNVNEVREGSRTVRRSSSAMGKGRDDTDIPSAAKNLLRRGIKARFGGVDSLATW